MVKLAPYRQSDSFSMPLRSRVSVSTIPPSTSRSKHGQRTGLLLASMILSIMYALDIKLDAYTPLHGRSLRARINAYPEVSKAVFDGLSNMVSERHNLKITSWNIAAINNNPFEYWITYDENPAYEKLMIDLEKFIEKPGSRDVAISEVFTEKMFDDLESAFEEVGWSSVRSYWEEDFKDRSIISDFLKDPLIGSKRLVSMPDRVTNTIYTEDTADSEPVCRPTVINMYEGDLSTLKKWWRKWKEFMFLNKVRLKGKDGKVKKMYPYEMLQPIKKSKYPDISRAEERDSLPLQTLCNAIFDAILVHMMNSASEPEDWQSLKQTMVKSLIRNKIPRTLEILEDEYLDSDIITLQEVSTMFIAETKKSKLGSKFHVISPKKVDPTRDQNSIILLRKSSFPNGASAELTSEVVNAFPEDSDVPLSKGDLLAITTIHKDGVPMVVASFHGDTDGLATKPVLSALATTMLSDSELISAKLVFGLDANTYEKPANRKKKQEFEDWVDHFNEYGLTSCWGDNPKASNYTTYNARTYMQPQLNKACKKANKREKGDVNPKDFILFESSDFRVVKTWKDNTGNKKFVEDMAFPTLDFPSDHSIISTIIEVKKQAIEHAEKKGAEKTRVREDDQRDQGRGSSRQGGEKWRKDEAVGTSVSNKRKLNVNNVIEPFKVTTDELGLQHTGSIGIPSLLKE